MAVQIRLGATLCAAGPVFKVRLEREQQSATEIVGAPVLVEWCGFPSVTDVLRFCVMARIPSLPDELFGLL